MVFFILHHTTPDARPLPYSPIAPTLIPFNLFGHRFDPCSAGPWQHRHIHHQFSHYPPLSFFFPPPSVVSSVLFVLPLVPRSHFPFNCRDTHSPPPFAALRATQKFRGIRERPILEPWSNLQINPHPSLVIGRLLSASSQAEAVSSFTVFTAFALRLS